ncbi:thy-1 membrane glycoprotein [Pygocentrus nattereri]|uniref:thy-1 membrane glycoprotein n=1 Tax=Pygocentrus nattereri TaxID=42514 RepID=UPI000EA63AD3|nr:thy-1 membrane glycoprotein [Pygocentrus nattereri]
MISYTIIVSFFLLGMVSAQTGVILEACGNQEVLEMMCKINSTSINTCIYYSKEKVVVSSGGVPPQDSTYKDRAKIVKTDKVCKLTLTGLEDHNQTFTCTINDFKPVLKTVNKKTLSPCSACSVIQHTGVSLLLALLASHLMSKLL